MQRRWGLGALAIGLLLGGMSLAGADEPGSGEIKQEIQALQGRLTALEARLVEQQRTVPPTSGEGLPQMIPGVKMSGFVDTSYTWSFNRPDSRTNSLRVFDTRAGDFMVNNVELVLEKPVNADSRVGFRTDLDFGTDSEVLGSVTSGLGANAHTHGQAGETAVSDEVELQQAYAEFLAPLGNGLDIKMGKFVTMHGAEVIEAKDNWNFSRSFLFGYAIPFTHTGMRASYPWTEWLSTTMGVSNGWDIVDDNNKAKTLEFNTTIVPTKTTSLGVTYMFGAEKARDSHDRRHLVDVVAGWNPTEQLALKLNYDLGWEDDGLSNTPAENAQWQGIAMYGRYQWLPWWATALRWEWFSDLAAVRAAQAGLRGLHLYEWTLTNEFKVYKDMIARVEYRHDSSNDRVFTRNKSATSYQDTLALEMIYPF